MELLVVVAIVVIVSAAALPAIRPALSQRKVSSAALLVQSELARCRDTAIHANAPRGIRLMTSLEDRYKFVPYPPGASPTAAQLQSYYASTPAYTRILSIEPAPDYSSGVVCMKPVGYVDNPMSPETDNQGNPLMAFLRVQECFYFYPNPSLPALQLPNERTNWYWNVRVGDKFRFHDSGNIYTIVGPRGLSDPTVNPEGYVNNDTSAPGDYGMGIQFLYLVNGIDDDNNGYVDDSFDNINNNYPFDSAVDPAPGYSIWPGWPAPDMTGIHLVTESEPESFVGKTVTQLTLPNGLDEDGDGVIDNLSEPDAKFSQLPYTIQRRPIPSPGARVLNLPTDTAIDMTGWNLYPAPQMNERSRLPIDPKTGFIDILIAPNGQVLKADYNTTQPGPPQNFPFIHFWISDSDDIVEPIGLGPPIAPPPHLPISSPPGLNWTGPTLKGERRLVSINTRTGQIVTGSAESFFDVYNNYSIDQPFFNVEHGIRDEQ